jgi:uncharacterized protein (DUF1501 family)
MSLNYSALHSVMRKCKLFGRHSIGYANAWLSIKAMNSMNVLPSSLLNRLRPDIEALRILSGAFSASSAQELRLIAEGASNGRLGALDGALDAVESHMGAAWQQTAVVVITQFGRTARINGTEGTDHGSAMVALLAGGAVTGGRVIADWPGLSAGIL